MPPPSGAVRATDGTARTARDDVEPRYHPGGTLARGVEAVPAGTGGEWSAAGSERRKPAPWKIHGRECPRFQSFFACESVLKMRNRAENVVSGNVWACRAVAILSAVQTPGAVA